MTIKQWLNQYLPDLSGKTIIITGANSGIGYEAARLLAYKGAHIVLTSRNIERGKQAASNIRSQIPNASIKVEQLDLAELDSIAAFSKRVLRSYDRIDVLINNAGVMALPYQKTRHGFEMQFGTNHLGHFALTGRLMPRLLKNPHARIVTVSSSAHQIGKISFDNLHWDIGYKRWKAYGQSKVANLFFTYELQRKLNTAGSSAIAVAVHPGWAATNLQTAAPIMENSRFKTRLYSWLNTQFAQSAEMGALPTVYAAAAEKVRGGQYVGPDGFSEAKGFPKITKSNNYSYNKEIAAQLWQVSEKLTGVHFNFSTVRAFSSI